MKSDSKIVQRVKPYIQAMPDVFNYQIVTKLLLGVWIFLLKKIFSVLLKSSGRVALTTGDWKFLFNTWQGLGILILGFVSLFVYVAFDLNSKIVLSREILSGEKVSFVECIKEGFASIRKLLNLRGLLVVLYIALIAPILGFGVSISMTEELYIPTFISSVIKDSVLYSALAGIVTVVFFVAGIANLFILHGILIDDMPIDEASRQSRAIIKANWKDYLLRNILYILTIGAILAAIAVVCLFLPLKIITSLALPKTLARILTIFFVLAGALVSGLADMFGIPMYLLKMTQLYYGYRQGSKFEFPDRTDESRRKITITAAIVLVVVIVAVFLINANFDRMFPAGTDVKVVAHRGGGNEGSENTVSGLKIAGDLGASGSEIDVQRTKDGYYVINHDGSFKRVAGVRKKPKDMTLKEVKALSINGEPVPTFEEMLDASKGRVVLFTELKGSTADRQMADDIVKTVKQNHMEDECVIISLKYGVIDYIETTYPEIETGFLTFASFGDTAELNCDYLGLEEESATVDAINSIHREGKKVLVWTPNDKESQKYFLCSEADGIITDNVKQAMKIASQLEDRSDLDRMVDRIKTVM